MVFFLRTKDTELKQERKKLRRDDKKDSSNGDSLYTKGRSSKRNNVIEKKGKSQSRGRLKSREGGT